MATLSREHVIAALLVTGVVVIVGFASGLGLRTTTSSAQPGGSGPTQTLPNAHAPLPEGGLPQAIQPPGMSMQGTEVPVSESAVSTPAAPGQSVPGDAGSLPSLPATQPGKPTAPGQPTTSPGTPPPPGTCVPGVVQQVANTANTVVAGLPVVGGLGGTLSLTPAPDGSSPGTLNTLLYTVIGYCPSPDSDATASPTVPPGALSSSLGSLVPALPTAAKAGG